METAMPGETVDALDARLDAQRRVLGWVLDRLVTTQQEFDDLIAHLDEPRIPQDHQEDPGAVPTEAFGAMSAFNAEMRAVLDPVKRGFAGRQ
jgi:hypothetical protein